MNRIAPEVYKIEKRQALLVRLKEYFKVGYRDPGLLYLGGRYAVSLGMEKEARQWLEQLSKVFIQDGKAAPGYFPVGLLYLHILPQGEKRETVIQYLQGLSSNKPELKRLCELAVSHSELFFSDQAPIMDKLKSHPPLYEMSQSISKRLRPKKTNEEIYGKYPGDTKNLKPIQMLQLLSETSSQAYKNNNITGARLALEEILLIDGDQPDVLRNLITLASEQKDIEAYERYWRRYVRVLLWRIMRGDGSAAAWYDLVLFYKRVATIMERECDKTPDEVSKVLRRPAFLSRWLETMAGLVWLKCASQPWRSLQTGIGMEEMKKGRMGSLSLMKYWFRVFYPDFFPFLLVSENIKGKMPLVGVEYNLNLYFDPRLKLFTRFLQWSKFKFALGKETDVHHKEAVFAFGCFLARLPVNQYLMVLAEELTDDYKNESIKQVLNEELNLLFKIKFNELLESRENRSEEEIQEVGKENRWRKVVDLLGDPEIQDVLSKELKHYLALAYSITKEVTKALDTLCLMLPELTKEEGEKEENQLYLLWQNVLWTNIQVIAEDESIEKAEEAFDRIKRKITDIRISKEINYFKMKLLENLEMLYIQQVISPRAGEALRKHQYKKARQFITKLPDEPGSIKKIKQDFLKQIDEAESLNRRINESMEEIRYCMKNVNFEEARKVARALPKEVKDLKDHLLDQIDEAEERYNSEQRIINDAIEKVKGLLGEGKFKGARRVIRQLPREAKELKEHLLDQVDEAEEQFRIKQRIEETIEEVKELLANGKFSESRRVIRGLPQEAKELKDNLLDQVDGAEEHYKIQQRVDKGAFSEARRVIRQLYQEDKGLKGSLLLHQVDEAEEHYKIKQRIEETIKKVKGILGERKFKEARRVIRQLPSEVKELKDNLLSQVDESERQHKRIDETIKKVKEFLNWGNFSEARWVIRQLPPEDILHKENLLDQVDEIERRSKHEKKRRYR
ncbi:MAG: hypothetical protein PVH61_21340 [Candidatus Aminicenantes bacterium]|jgi:hypothetical protein